MAIAIVLILFFIVVSWGAIVSRNAAEVLNDLEDDETGLDQGLTSGR